MTISRPDRVRYIFVPDVARPARPQFPLATYFGSCRVHSLVDTSGISDVYLLGCVVCRAFMYVGHLALHFYLHPEKRIGGGDPLFKGCPNCEWGVKKIPVKKKSNKVTDVYIAQVRTEDAIPRAWLEKFVASGRDVSANSAYRRWRWLKTNTDRDIFKDNLRKAVEGAEKLKAVAALDEFRYSG